MNFHQKLATLLIRVVALVLLIVSGMGVVDFAVVKLQRLPDDQASARLGSAVTWMVGGLVVYAQSRRLGRLVSEDLEEGDKPGPRPDEIA